MIWLALLLQAAIPTTAPQGSILRGQLPPGAFNPVFNGTSIAMTADRRFLIGLDRDAGPVADLNWRTADGGIGRQIITVTSRQWRIQSLPNLPLRPVPDAIYESRRPDEVARIRAARADISTLPHWQGRFIRPAAGATTGVFGSQRIYAGVPSAYHAGLDTAAPTGTPVIAPAAGRVLLAQGPLTLEGNLVLLDHGFGLVSAFLHLSRIDVTPGQMLAQGDPIGAIGTTGRSTGPHLHWGVTWTNVRIDPATLLELP